MSNTRQVEENISCVEQYYAACMDRDWDRAFSAVSRDVTYQHPAFRRPQGHATLRLHFEGFLQAFPDVQRQVVLCFGQGDWVCMETRWSGTNTEPFIRPNGRSTPATNRSLDTTDLGVFKIEEGVITEIRLYEDLLSFRRQLRRRRRR
jgi:steroid delta-isomerase-like uncharacterized protein